MRIAVNDQLFAVQQRPQPFSLLHRRLGTGVRQQQQKLFATPARHHILLAHRNLKRSRQRFQHLVTDVVAELIVDVLEMVDIDQHQRERAPRAVFTRHFILQPLRHRSSITQLGQKIGAGGFFQ